MAEILAPSPVPSQTRSIGMIHPPPDVRKIIDKTAVFVARNGADFERKIISGGSGNKLVKVEFLNPSNPYHAYYQQKVLEEKAGNKPPAEPPSKPDELTNKPAELKLPPKPFELPKKPSLYTTLTQKVLPKVVPEPPKAQFTLNLPAESALTGQELDVIKVTAQFCALNGSSFLTDLWERNSAELYDFLHPTHRLYPVFSALRDAYAKVLHPPEDLVEKLKREATKDFFLESCLIRLEWEKSQEKSRQDAKVEEELERLIDWDDAVIVETLTFADDEDELLPAPVTLADVIRNPSKYMAFEEAPVEVDMQVDEEQSVKPREIVQVVVPGDQRHEPEMRIVKNWRRPEERLAQDQKRNSKTVLCPVTGDLINESDMQEHIRIALIDPRFQEQKQRMMAKRKGSTLASDEEIYHNLVQAAQTMAKTTEEEVSEAFNTKRKEEPPQVIWDGHSGSINKVLTQTPTFPVPVSLPPVIPPVMHPGFQAPIPAPVMHPSFPMPVMHPSFPVPVMHPSFPVPAMGFPAPFMQTGFQIPASQAFTAPASAPVVREGPPVKRQRLDEEALLVPEGDFAVQYPGPVKICVAMAASEGQGRVLEVTMQSVHETISSLKEKIAGEIGVPANKQKLSSTGIGFLKDTKSLAFYNVGPGGSLELSVRERGGKKKN